MAFESPTRGTTPVNVTVKIVSAYVLKNYTSPSEMLRLIETVHGALVAIVDGRDRSHEQAKLLRVQQSITPNALISFLDGKPYKSLKRHLTSLGFDPKTYRAEYALPDDYPMVAPGYAVRRSQIARDLGLGRRKKNSAPRQT